MFVSPCQLPFLGSLLLSSCSGWEAPFLLTRLALAFLECSALWQLVVVEVPYVIFVLVSGIILLWIGFQSLGNGVAELQVDIRRYRQLQVLENLINSCVRRRIFPVITACLPLVEIVGGFILLKLHSFLDPSQLITFYCTLFNMLVLSGAGSIHSKSFGWLVAARNGVVGNKAHKVLRREIMSLLPMRVWFSSNFVDHLTTLVVQDFCINQTITLLLME